MSSSEEIHVTSGRSAGARSAVNLADLLRRAATEAPEKVALVEAASGRRVTWAQLDRDVDRIAAGLVSMGLVPGYRVALVLNNRVEFVSAYLGALRARLVAVPVNPRSATGELVRVLADCTSRVVVADDETVTMVRAAVAGLEDALVGADEELRARTPVPRMVVVAAPALPGEQRLEDLNGDAVVEPVEDPDSLAVLLYTSGASSRPRAAMLSHRNLLANIAQVAAVEPPMIDADDVVLGVLPLFHVYGLNAVLGQVLNLWARLVLVDHFDAEGVLDVIDDEAVSVLPVAPPVFGHWLAADDLADRLGSVRLVMSGSAPLDPEVAARFTEQTGLPVHQGYGLTEAAPVVTTTLGLREPKSGSVGRALPGIRLRLVDETGAAPEGDDPGEIQVAGDNLFSGYWPDGEGGPTDGWYSTGDVGFLDDDGELFLVDRLGDLIIVSGFNVYPVEVEEVLGELDEVAESAVIGAASATTGETVTAYVVPKAGTSLTDAELVALVQEHCASRLARFKQPTQVSVVSQLPHTVTGKVAKGQLRSAERRRALGLIE